MRARKIITGAVPALVIACLQLGRFINGLVNPVPDAAAYDTGRIADRLPVKVQIADSIAHCVSVFAEKHRLVKEGTADIANARVHRSADYLISSATFPTYFLKDNVDASVVNADLDIQLFAKRIAPALGITKRFVGTEPFCPVTRAYNERMKQVLPEYGVEVIEIERKDGISASKVRQLLAEGEKDKVRTLVPECTYKYLYGGE